MTQSNLGVAQEYAQGVVRSLVGGAPGTSIYGYGNNNGNGELPQAPVSRSWRGLRGDGGNCNVLPMQDLSSLLEEQHLSMILLSHWQTYSRGSCIPMALHGKYAGLDCTCEVSRKVQVYSGPVAMPKLQLMALAAMCRKPHAEREHAVQSLGILTAWAATFLNLRWRPMAMPATSILAEQSGARMLLGRQAACRWAARLAHLSSLAKERDVRDAIRSLGTLAGQQRGNAECTAQHMPMSMLRSICTWV